MGEGFDIPKVGDIWVYDEDDGTIVECAVTAVEPPDQPWDDWRVGFDGRGGLRHRGWWYGQGWSEKEDEEERLLENEPPVHGLRPGTRVAFVRAFVERDRGTVVYAGEHEALVDYDSGARAQRTRISDLLPL